MDPKPLTFFAVAKSSSIGDSQDKNRRKHGFTVERFRDLAVTDKGDLW